MSKLRKGDRPSAGWRILLTWALAFPISCCAVHSPQPGGAAAPRGTGGGGSPGRSSPIEEEAGAGSAGAEEAAEKGEDGEGDGVDGWSSTYLRYRRTSDAEDLDLVETLSLDLGVEGRDPATGHILLYTAADLDGRDFDDGSDSDFFDLDDTYDSSAIARLYEAYVDIHSVGGLEELRLGRQSMYDTPAILHFDGAWLETEASEEHGTSLGAYVGRPVHFFETAFDDDFVAGTSVESRPWDSTRLRFDYVHLEDENRTLSTKDDLWSLRGWQQLGDQLRLSAGHTRLGSEERDWFWRGHWYDPESDLSAQVHFYELLEPQGQLSLELDPYSSLLFELRPYRQWRVQASKGVSEHLTIEAGFALRDVTKSADEGEFNREFDRRHLGINLTELPGDLDLSLTGVVYDDSGTEIETLGADLDKDLGEAWRASVGTYYALYEIDLFQGRERDHSRLWYVRARNRRSEDFMLDLRFEYEEDDFDDYLITRVGLRWAF